MFGYVDGKPTFKLPSGSHEFRVECDGYRTVQTKMKVLNAGSEQWLVVTLHPVQEKSITTPNVSLESDQAGRRPKEGLRGSTNEKPIVRPR